MTALLRTEGLACRFGNLRALDGVDFHVEEGEILGLIGPNGAGKTTFFNVLTGLTPASGGATFWRGEDISRLAVEERARLGIIRTFQQARAFQRLSVIDNLRLAQGRGGRLPEIGSILHETGMERVSHIDARDLQYADLRRLGIALALAAGPQLLCLDEPAAGLSPAETAGLMDVVRRVNQRQVTVCLIEHDMRFLMGLSGRVVVLDAGRKIAEGSPAEVQRDRRVIEVYLGSGELGAQAGRA